MMVLLELDPSLVRPGWMPLVILLVLGAALVLLFFSMRKQFRKIDAHQFEDQPTTASSQPTTTGSQPAPTGSQSAAAGQPARGGKG